MGFLSGWFGSRAKVAALEAELAEVKAASGSMLASGPRSLGAGASKLTKAAEQYKHNGGWPYVAIRAISQRVAGQPVFVARVGNRRRAGGPKLALPGFIKSMGERLEPLDGHALLDALAEPNPIMLRWQLMCSVVGSLELTGRAFLWMPPGPNGRPEFWPLPSNWVQAEDLLRSSWLVRTKWGQEFQVRAEEMALFSLPDPSDPFGSLSPLQAQAPAIGTDEALQVAQYRSFKNGGFPQLMVRAGRLPGMVPGQQGDRPVLTAEQRRELIDSILAVYQGAVNYGEPLIVDGLIEGVDRLTDKPQELDFLESGKSTKSRILQAYGVNPIIVGEIENANRAQAVVAEESFCDSCVNPLLEMVSQALTRWVCPRFAGSTERLAAWIEPATANDPELQLKRWEAGLKTGAVTLNEYRRHVLNLEDLPTGGDEPMSLFGSSGSRIAAPGRNGTAGRCSTVQLG